MLCADVFALINMKEKAHSPKACFLWMGVSCSHFIVEALVCLAPTKCEVLSVALDHLRIPDEFDHYYARDTQEC